MQLLYLGDNKSFNSLWQITHTEENENNTIHKKEAHQTIAIIGYID